MSARSLVLAEQRFLARFLADERFEAEVRSDPVGAARAHDIEIAVAEHVAAIAPARVQAFRASMDHKTKVRARGRPGGQ